MHGLLSEEYQRDAEYRKKNAYVRAFISYICMARAIFPHEREGGCDWSRRWKGGRVWSVNTVRYYYAWLVGACACAGRFWLRAGTIPHDVIITKVFGIVWSDMRVGWVGSRNALPVLCLRAMPACLLLIIFCNSCLLRFIRTSYSAVLYELAAALPPPPFFFLSFTSFAFLFCGWGQKTAG